MKGCVLKGQPGKRTSLRALTILEQLSVLSFPSASLDNMVNALLPMLLGNAKKYVSGRSPRKHFTVVCTALRSKAKEYQDVAVSSSVLLFHGSKLRHVLDYR